MLVIQNLCVFYVITYLIGDLDEQGHISASKFYQKKNGKMGVCPCPSYVWQVTEQKSTQLHIMIIGPQSNDTTF